MRPDLVHADVLDVVVLLWGAALCVMAVLHGTVAMLTAPKRRDTDERAWPSERGLR